MAYHLKFPAVDFDLKTDYYAENLAEVNKTNDVVSIDDIINQRGVLLVKNGARICYSTSQKILNHRLARPLEQQVKIKDTVDKNNLCVDFHYLLQKYPDMRKVHLKNDYEKTFENLLLNSKIDAVLLQKLTVLQDRLYNVYEKALFCAWLSSLIAREMGLGNNAIEIAFNSGLIHNMGLLHLNPNIIKKKNSFTNDEWRVLQSHVLINQLLLTNMNNSIHPRTAKAVLEHQERCDGTGYPSGKTEKELDIIGQILGMADNVYLIRVERFERVGRNFFDLIPYLQMNSDAQLGDINRAMHSIIRKSELKSSRVNAYGTIRSLITVLISRGYQLKKSFTLIEEVGLISQNFKVGVGKNKLNKVVDPMIVNNHRSGLLNAEIFNWLRKLQIKPSLDLLPELIEMDLMQTELLIQIERVCKVIDQYLEIEGNIIAHKRRNRLRAIVYEIGLYINANTVAEDQYVPDLVSAAF